jgi:hypothetical protein
MQNISSRVISFILFFIVLFSAFRYFGKDLFSELHANLNGIAWLYSTISLIFSLISAFIIQTLWNRWDRLENSVRGELNSLWALNMFSEQLPLKVGGELRICIKNYLENLLKEGWKQIEKGERDENVEEVLKAIQRKIFKLSEQAPEKRDMAEEMFMGLLNNRNDRMYYSTGHLPFLLYLLILMSTILIIFLSFLISIPNIYLDFIFTFSIALLAFFIFLVIEDLNHPFRPGTWHVTKDGYKALLREVQE